MYTNLGLHNHRTLELAITNSYNASMDKTCDDVEIVKTPRELKAIDCMEQFVKGLTYREMAKVLGISKTDAHHLVKKQLQEAAKLRQDLGSAAIELELGRIETITKACLESLNHTIEVHYVMEEDGEGNMKPVKRDVLVKRIDEKTGNLLLKAMERKSKYLGQDQAQKVDVNVSVSIEQLIIASNKPELLAEPDVVDAEIIVIEEDEDDV